MTLTSCGQITVNISSKFVKTEPPKSGTDEWRKLNYSNNEFGVKIENDTLKIEKVNKINNSQLKISNGILKGINRGEWGGKLSFIPSDTSKNEIEIKKGNIKFIFEFKNKIYFIEGLAHLSYSGGAIFELINTNGTFTYNKIVEFDDAPEAFTIFNNKLLIATHRNFYIIKDFKKELVFKDTFWSSLYPNSIAVVDEKNVYLGIRGGIVKLDLINKKIEFYKNTK
jgi:hypothetical protein